MQNILRNVLLVKIDTTVHYILVRKWILQKHEIIKNLSENICMNAKISLIPVIFLETVITL